MAMDHRPLLGIKGRGLHDGAEAGPARARDPIFGNGNGDTKNHKPSERSGDLTGVQERPGAGHQAQCFAGVRHAARKARLVEKLVRAGRRATTASPARLGGICRPDKSKPFPGKVVPFFVAAPAVRSRAVSDHHG